MGQVNQPTDVNSKLREHDRLIAELTKRVGLSSAVISRGGLRIINNGELVMVDENETVIFKVGQVNFGAGTSYGMRLNFDNGNPAFLLGGSPGDQAWALYDENLSYVVTNDAASGFGLARPYLNYRLVPTTSAESATPYPMWPSTTSGSPIGLLEGDNPICHPRMTYRIVTLTAGGGNVNWAIKFGADTAASGTGTSSGIVNTPGWGTTILPYDQRNITVEASVTGGATRAFIQVTRCYGIQS